MSDLEAQLRSWSPRRPSPRLERAIFERRETETSDESDAALRPGFSFQWLAPATALLVVLCMLFSERNSASITSAAGGSRMVAMIMSNQSAAPYLPGSFTRDANILSAANFEWTNGSHSTSHYRPSKGN
jgi:hypothetical protein